MSKRKLNLVVQNANGEKVFQHAVNDEIYSEPGTFTKHSKIFQLYIFPVSVKFSYFCLFKTVKKNPEQNVFLI